MLVYPAPGLRVRDPDTRKFVPVDGLDVSEHSVVWARLVRDGDVVTTKPKPVEPPAPAEAPQASQLKEPTSEPQVAEAPPSEEHV